MKPNSIYNLELSEVIFHFHAWLGKLTLNSIMCLKCGLMRFLRDTACIEIWGMAGVPGAICNTIRASVPWDKSCIEGMFSPWCPDTHTSVTAWGGIGLS